MVVVEVVEAAEVESAADVALSSAVAKDAAFVDDAAFVAAVGLCVCSIPSIDWMACIWFTTSE